MFPPLYDEDRRSLARTAGMLTLGAAAVLLVTAQTSSIANAQGTTAAHVASLPALPGPLTFPSFTLKRDPFQTDHLSGVVPAAQGSSIGIVLPPNLGAGNDSVPTISPDRSTGIALRAIVIGERSRALVDLGGTVQVLGVGDRIGNLTISSIDSSGITLADGSRILLESNK